MVAAAIGGAMHRHGGACVGVNGDRRGWRAGWVFLCHGDAEGFLFLFLNWVVRIFCPTKNFGGDGLLERTVCDLRSRQNDSHCTRLQFWEPCVIDVLLLSWFIGLPL